MRPTLATLLCLAVQACGTAPLEQVGQADDAGADPATEPVSCEPAPGRCEALGDERPGRLSEHSAVYDPERLELIVFGGTASIPEACSFGYPVQFESETWIYDDPCAKWTRIEGPGPSESGRHMAAMGEGVMWVFGGRVRDSDMGTGPYFLFRDLFRFDVATRRWSNAEVDGSGPSARINGGLAWDSSRDLLWLFGGNSSADGALYEPLDDLWAYDPEPSTWEQHSVEDGPTPRLFHSMLYDSLRDALIVYGGADTSAFSNDASYHRDLWALELSEMTWRPLSAGGVGTPEGRFWPGLVHDRTQDAYLLFGGHDDQALGNRNDTWRFDPEGLRWTREVEGDTFNSPARDVCDFPPDFTNVDDGAPERRSAHGLVWSQPCGHALLFGGKTDCGSIDDVWRYVDEGWEVQLPATEGEACLRWRQDPDTCGDMCF